VVEATDTILKRFFPAFQAGEPRHGHFVEFANSCCGSISGLNVIMKRSAKSKTGYALLLVAGICLAPHLTLGQDQEPVRAKISPAPQELDVLPRQILSVSDVTAQIQVTQHYSRVLKMRSNVTRTFIADPRIAEIVQFGANEVVLVGLGQGSTTLTMWFEDPAEPLVVQVESLANPAKTEDVITEKREDGESEISQTSKEVRRRPPARAADRPPQVISTTSLAASKRSAKCVPAARPAPAPAPSARYDGHALWPTAPSPTGRKALPSGLPPSRPSRAP
jgi:hypothetical protein